MPPASRGLTGLGPQHVYRFEGVTKFVTHPFLYRFEGERDHTLNEETQNYMGGVSAKFSSCFPFSASQISRYGVSPDLRSTIFLSAFPSSLLKQRSAD